MTPLTDKFEGVLIKGNLCDHLNDLITIIITEPNESIKNESQKRDINGLVCLTSFMAYQHNVALSTNTGISTKVFLNRPALIEPMYVWKREGGFKHTLF